MKNLFCALGYKEWIKTRRLLGVMVLLFAAVLVYTLIEMSYTIRVSGAVNVWYAYLYQGLSVAPMFVWLPCFAGLSLALVQFVPEMTNKRLKLTLHLPAAEGRIMSCMLLFGLLVLVVLFSVYVILLVVCSSFYLPNALLIRMLSQVFPWVVAGIVAYGFTAWVCIEPQWRMRVCNGLTACAVIAIFYVSMYPGVYAGFVVQSVLVACLAWLFPIYSCVRFKEGIQ